MTVSSRGTRNHMASATDDKMATTQQTNSKAANEPSDSYVETKRQAVIEAREQALQAKAEAVRVKAQFRAEAIRAKAEEKASRTLAKAENRALKIEGIAPAENISSVIPGMVATLVPAFAASIRALV